MSECWLYGCICINCKGIEIHNFPRKAQQQVTHEIVSNRQSTFSANNNIDSLWQSLEAFINRTRKSARHTGIVDIFKRYVGRILKLDDAFDFLIPINYWS